MFKKKFLTKVIQTLVVGGSTLGTFAYADVLSDTPITIEADSDNAGDGGVLIRSENNNAGDDGVVGANGTLGSYLYLYDAEGNTWNSEAHMGADSRVQLAAPTIDLIGATYLDNTTIQGTATITGTTQINGSTTVNGSNITLGNDGGIQGPLATAVTIGNGNSSTDVVLAGGTAELSLDTQTVSISNSAFNAQPYDLELTHNSGVGAASLSVQGATSSIDLSATGDSSSVSMLINKTSMSLGVQSDASTGVTEVGSFTTNGASLVNGLSVDSSSASLSAGSGASVTSYSDGMTVNQGADYTLVAGDATSQAVVTDGLGTNSVDNIIVGDTLVDGDVYINGTLTYSSDSSAVTSVTTNDGSGVAAGTTIANEGSERYTVDANGALVAVGPTDPDADAAAGTTAALTVTNESGNTHGIVVTETQTTMSGGVNSSSLTLGDNGATFSDSATGAPVQVHGVMDGTSDFDAVNVRQFAGAIAAAAAMTNIPQVPMGQKGTFGFGAASFMGKSAIAMGTSYRFSENGILKASASVNNGGKQRPIISIGAGWSW